MANTTLKGAGGKAIRTGAPCLAPGPGNSLTPGTLKSVNEDGAAGMFRPDKPLITGAITNEFEVRAGTLLEKWPL